jgi:multisubunit Na+/H+ antiporter MnhC subunit
MNNSKFKEFHKPFIHALVIVGLVTGVSMISTRYLVNYILTHHYNTPVYTSYESQGSTK